MPYDPKVLTGEVQLSAEELRKDHRRRYDVPEGIKPGTTEYYQWWLSQNKERQKLYQKKAYLKRKLVERAVLQHDTTSLEATTIDEKIADVEMQIALLQQTPSTSSRRRPTPSTAEPEEDARIPFVVEMAQMHSVTYDEALQIMEADGYEGDISFTKFKEARLTVEEPKA